jgi:uroporphyrinogen decarboxylase
MVFDSWGGVLADGAFQEFSLAYTARVLAKVKKTHGGVRIPRIVFTKGGGLWLQEMGGLDCDVLGLDWTVNLARARALVGENAIGSQAKALQGNIDPNVLFANSAQIQAEVAKVLTSFGAPHQAPATAPDATGPTHIFNLGHGISQHTPPDNVAELVQAVHSVSRKMRAV